MTGKVYGRLEDFQTPINVRLALLWASLMFLYIYNDYFSMYTPGTIDSMAQGSFGQMGKAGSGTLVAMSMLLAIPSLMIFLSAILTPWLNRWLNVALGLAYSGIEALTLPGSPLFYKIVAIAEIVLTASIVWIALRWPRRAA